MWTPDPYHQGENYPNFLSNLYGNNNSMSTLSESLRSDNNYYDMPMPSVSTDNLDNDSSLPNSYPNVKTLNNQQFYNYNNECDYYNSCRYGQDIVQCGSCVPQQLTYEQNKILESAFMKHKYIKKRMNSLTERSGLTAAQIYFWFQNRRFRGPTTVIANKSYGGQSPPQPTQSGDAEQMKTNGRNKPPRKFTCTELSSLTDMYKDTNGYPCVSVKTELADKFGVKYNRVDNWFKNARKRSKLVNSRSMQSFTESSERIQDSESARQTSCSPDNWKENEPPNVQYRNDLEICTNSTTTYTQCNPTNVDQVQLYPIDQSQNVAANENYYANDFDVPVIGDSIFNLNTIEQDLFLQRFAEVSDFFV